MDSTARQLNDNNQYGRELEEQTEKRSSRPFCFSWGPPKYLEHVPHWQGGAVSHQAKNPTHINTGSSDECSFWGSSKVCQGALIWIVLGATQEKALSHAQWGIRCSQVLLCAPRSWEHLELPLQAHVAQQALSEIPIPVNRSLSPICLSGVWKFNTCLQVSYAKGAVSLLGERSLKMPTFFFAIPN